MGTHPIFESDFDCLTETKTMSVTVPREELNSLLDEFRKGKKSNFGQLESFTNLNAICKMQLDIHKKHYQIDADNPKKDQLACNLTEMEKVNVIFDDMKLLSTEIKHDL